MLCSLMTSVLHTHIQASGKAVFADDLRLTYCATLVSPQKKNTHTHIQASGKAVFADDLRLTVQPSCLQNGTLREYQLEV
jgi:hypothetical protein